MMRKQTELTRLAVTAVLAGAAVLSAGYWVRGLRASLADTPALPRAAPVTGVVAGTAADLGRALGAPAALAGAGAAAERFQVIGMLARASGQGVALIAVDGQPARVFAVGAELAPGFVLQAVTPSTVSLADGPQAPVRASLAVPDPARAKSDTPAATGEAGNPGANAPPGAAMPAGSPPPLGAGPAGSGAPAMDAPGAPGAPGVVPMRGSPDLGESAAPPSNAPSAAAPPAAAPS